MRLATEPMMVRLPDNVDTMASSSQPRAGSGSEVTTSFKSSTAGTLETRLLRIAAATAWSHRITPPTTMTVAPMMAIPVRSSRKRRQVTEPEAEIGDNERDERHESEERRLVHPPTGEGLGGGVSPPPTPTLRRLDLVALARVVPARLGNTHHGCKSPEEHEREDDGSLHH